jgi:uncharacterized small protein (DUF1192 family)
MQRSNRTAGSAKNSKPCIPEDAPKRPTSKHAHGSKSKALERAGGVDLEERIAMMERKIDRSVFEP